MGLGSVEDRIKSIDESKIRISNGVCNKIEGRGLKPELIRTHLKNREFKAIIYQEGDTYKIAIEYDTEHDLCIIIRFDRGFINIKTAFPQDKKRRIKGKWQ